jgi:hypothetical protein
MEDRRDTNPPSSVNRPGDRNTEPYLGGADAVQKTTYNADVHGAESAGATETVGGVTAAVPSRRGLGPLGWTVLVLATLVLVAYAAGVVT